MSIDYLESPYGVVSGLVRARPPRGLADYWCVTGVGGSRHGHGGEPVLGCGRVLRDHETARLIALAETAERCSGLTAREERMIWNSARELRGRAAIVEPERLPALSAAELARPECPLVPFDEDARIRWIAGTDLLTGGEVWVPAVMACYGLHEAVPAERFWYRLSTGLAVHADMTRALVGGIREVIERDAIALTWLQRLRLPRLAPEGVSVDARMLIDWAERHFVATHLYDATTDLGVPTVYVLQIAEHDRAARQIVGCGTGADLAEAAEKALLETTGIRELFQDEKPIPPLGQFSSTLDGARFMARPAHAEAFDFLLEDAGRGEREVDTGASMPADPQPALGFLLETLRDKGMQAVAVDLTNLELAQAGLVGVSVLIPDLQPMTLHPYAQFRAHPRLYVGPVAMGLAARPESELNPWPQPFA